MYLIHCMLTPYMLTLLLYVGLTKVLRSYTIEGQFLIGNRHRNKNDMYIMNECPWVQVIDVPLKWSTCPERWLSADDRRK